MTAPPDGPPWATYVPEHRDEAIDADGAWRPHVAAALRDVRADLAQITGAIVDESQGAGLVFPTPDGAERFVIDPVPRVLAAEEWDLLERGVAQRARALNAFVADVHGPGRAVREGTIPARVIEEAEHHEPGARELAPASGVWIGIAGLDVIRGPDGAFQVLEDNARTPSGIAYALAARALVQEALGLAAVPARPIHGATDLLAETLAAAAPPDRTGDGTAPYVVVVTDGPGSPAYWEHRVLANHLDAPLVPAEELELDGDDRLVLRDAPQRPIDAVYRRTDSSTLEAPAHQLLRAAMAAGTVGMINGFGTGVADDKLTHAYVEDLIRLFLDEEPLLASVPTYDLQRPERREEVLDRLIDMVVKPRGGAGGTGVTICAHADDALLEATRTAIRDTPEAFVAQELVPLSTHPTAVDGRLQPRHVDLRPFAFLTPDGNGDTIARVVPGGLTRVALKEGSMIINSSQDGGAKDTWVMP